MALPLSSVVLAHASSAPSPSDIPNTLLDVGSLLNQWEKQIQIAATYYATRFRLCDDDYSDLAQVSRVALWQAVARYDVSRGIPIENYLRRAIRNAIFTALDFVVPDVHHVRIEDDMDDEDEEQDSRYEQSATLPVLTAPEHEIDIQRWLSRLDPTQQQLYDLLYRQGRSQKEAALALGVSQPRICQIHGAMLDFGKQELSGYGM